MFKCGFIVYDNVLRDDKKLMKELLCLENLSELSLTVRSASFLFNICNNLKVLNSLQSLHLQNIKDTEFVNISPLANSKQLRLLHISLIHDLEELVIENSGTHAPGSSLNNNLLFFSGLREVNVYGNYNMRDMTWLIFVPHLTILIVRSNLSMEEIISAEKFNEHKARDQHFNLFAKLQLLELYNLPKLTTICPVALSFPCLRNMEVRACPDLKKLPLNSESAEGCNVVIRAEESWWNELAWDNDDTQASFSSCFQKL